MISKTQLDDFHTNQEMKDTSLGEESSSLFKLCNIARSFFKFYFFSGEVDQTLSIKFNGTSYPSG